jgi:formamidopyrimidine-DNA glycosylase
VPELPEVETIVRDLRAAVVGRRIGGFASSWVRLTEPDPAEAFAKRMVGARISGVRRRGKFALLDLDTGEALVVSLRMTGRLLYRADGAAPEERFLRARISFAEGGELRFADQRKFGRMALISSASNVVAHRARAPLHQRLGIEPLSTAFTASRFAALLAARPRARIKPLLLDQTFIAGIGNIYANEALFRARIHPLRTSGSLRPAEVAALRDAIRVTLRRAIRLRGASIRDYRDGLGREGRMHREFLVHGREDEPCPRCGRPIRKSYVGGRGTYFCPACQRAPRAIRTIPAIRTTRAIRTIRPIRA